MYKLFDVFIFLCVPISALGLLVFPVELVSGILYPIAAIQVATAFHLFSTGNAAYSAGISYDSAEMFEMGNKMSQAGMQVALSAGCLVLGSFILKALTDEGDPSNLLSVAYGIVPYFLLILSSFLFSFALKNHRPYHKWFIYVKKAIRRNSTGMKTTGGQVERIIREGTTKDHIELTNIIAVASALIVSACVFIIVNCIQHPIIPPINS